MSGRRLSSTRWARLRALAFVGYGTLALACAAILTWLPSVGPAAKTLAVLGLSAGIGAAAADLLRMGFGAATLATLSAVTAILGLYLTYAAREPPGRTAVRPLPLLRTMSFLGPWPSPSFSDTAAI